MENSVQVTDTPPNIVQVVDTTVLEITVEQPATPGVVVVAASGPQGPPGAALATYTHTQTSASSQWTINHNLGFRPSVELFDSGGNEFDADILHVSNNQVMVYLTAPYSGFARLN